MNGDRDLIERFFDHERETRERSYLAEAVLRRVAQTARDVIAFVGRLSPPTIRLSDLYCPYLSEIIELQLPPVKGISPEAVAVTVRALTTLLGVPGEKTKENEDAASLTVTWKLDGLYVVLSEYQPPFCQIVEVPVEIPAMPARVELKRRLLCTDDALRVEILL